MRSIVAWIEPSRAIAIGLGLLAAVGCGPATPPGEPLRVFGKGGVQGGQFSYPRAAVFANDRYYIVDKTARVQAFTPAGEFVLQWSLPEWKAGKPVGIGAAPDGRIFVADTHYSRVMIYSPDGEPLDQFGRNGRGPGEFELPTDIVVAADGTIFVGEYGGNDRISQFTPDFEFVQSFPEEAVTTFARPQGVCLGPNGRLYVADASHHRIAIFEPDGTFVGAIGTPGTGLDELRFPYGLDFLSDETLVVAEYGNNRVQRLTLTGESLGTWGKPGRERGELAGPWAVAVGPNDEVLVVDSLNNRGQVIAGGDPETWSRPAE